ncbi:MAG: tetratricopeptide repeat protein [Stellaceae bacterium]
MMLLSWGAAAHAQQLERGLPECTPEAVAAARAGTAKGDPAATYKMARYYSTGKCIGGDGQEAINLYIKAAHLGYAPAFYNLWIIAAGSGQYKNAEFFFQKGAGLGHRGCELQLGILYSFPIPDVGNNAKTYGWLSLYELHEGKTDDTAKLLPKVAARLTPAQRVEVERLFGELKQKYGSLPEFQP